MSDVYDFYSCEIDRKKIEKVLINCKDDYS